MKAATLSFLALFALALPASAQVAPGITAGVDINASAVDPSRLKEIRCRLGLVNPRGCIERQTPSQQPSISSARGTIVSGARKPGGKRG